VVYDMRRNNHYDNFLTLKLVFNDNRELMSPLLTRCPKFDVILAFVLIHRLGVRVQKIDWTFEIADWDNEVCRRSGRSIATLVRTRGKGKAAVLAWKKEYPQIGELLDDVEGVEEFMIVIADSLVRDNRIGIAYRVSVGALLSITDTVTDIYVLSTYYQSGELLSQANAMLAMILTSLTVQLFAVLGNYHRMGWKVIVREALISIFFLRPVVDAYRVSSNFEDDAVTWTAMFEMIANKAIELTTESIPGCVLQVYVWLINPTDAGAYALVSIGISALTTGYMCALISFDIDVDEAHRSSQPSFYG